jgi:hypothetical protein
MSSRCTIAYIPHFHIYSCCNTNWAICVDFFDDKELRELDGHNSYNDDTMIRHAELYDLYHQLHKYFSSPIESQFVSYDGYGLSGPDRK